MSPFYANLIEWISTALSVVGFWLCIRHRSICFVVFLIADLGWFAAAWERAHVSLLSQQVVYVLMNIVGYIMWRRDDRLKARLEEIERRGLLTVQRENETSSHSASPPKAPSSEPLESPQNQGR